MAKVLIIDDDREICCLLEELIQNVNHESDSALTLSEGLQKASEDNFDVVFLDVNMPDGSGLEALTSIVSKEFAPEVIVMTGMGERSGAEKAITNGAWDYVQKPLSPKNIIQTLSRVLEYRDGIKASLESSNSAQEFNRLGIVGDGPAISSCFKSLASASKSYANVLITGETGTGKELFARGIHENSDRRNKSFVIVDCAAMPETLAENLLFGHRRGSFTGAINSSMGLVEEANGGTLFLDEVGEMSLNMQKNFLRVIQEKTYRPVGGAEEQKSDFRLVAATNKDLSELVKKGLFREDLLYRLNSISIKLPPLKERPEDMESLTNHFLNMSFEKLRIRPKTFSTDFLEAMKLYSWPGNVRELRNTLDSAVAQAMREPVIFARHLPPQIRIQLAQSSMQHDTPAHPQTTTIGQQFCDNRPLCKFKEYKKMIAAEVESAYLKRLMKESNGDIKSACAKSGLGRTRLYALLKEHNISRYGWDL